MAKQELPQNTVRINKTRFLRSGWSWGFGVVCVLLMAYGILMIGYYRNLYPLWVENAVHASRLAIFKEKTYLPGSVGSWDGVINPALTRVVSETEMKISYAG